jgi:hypothetical protein
MSVFLASLIQFPLHPYFTTIMLYLPLDYLNSSLLRHNWTLRYLFSVHPQDGTRVMECTEAVP